MPWARVVFSRTKVGVVFRWQGSFLSWARFVGKGRAFVQGSFLHGHGSCFRGQVSWEKVVCPFGVQSRNSFRGLGFRLGLRDGAQGRWKTLYP